MKKILQIAAGIVLGSVATTGVTMLFYKPLMKRVMSVSTGMVTEMIETLENED